VDLVTWSPFQSRQVQEICAHMTASERSRVAVRSFGYGIWFALTVGVPLGSRWWWSSSVAVRVFAACLLALHLGAIPLWQRRERRILCSTRWSRAHRIVPEQLQLFDFRLWKRPV
jgi:hypothetical protein